GGPGETAVPRCPRAHDPPGGRTAGPPTTSTTPNREVSDGHRAAVRAVPGGARDAVQHGLGGRRRAAGARQLPGGLRADSGGATGAGASECAARRCDPSAQARPARGGAPARAGRSGPPRAMSADVVRAEIARLQALRERAAAVGRQLAERELDARLLKLGIEGEHRQAGATQTAAEREARVDPSYIAHERATAALGEE